MAQSPAPYTGQTTLADLVNALDREERAKPVVEYEFTGGRRFTRPQNFNPYTGEAE